MAKSGKSRKANRRVREQTEEKLERIESLETELDQAHREDARLDNSDLTPIQTQQLVGRSVREGWNGRRWNTEITQRELSERIGEVGPEGVTAKEMALASVLHDMSSDESPAKARQAAVRNLLLMEKMNQDDEQEPETSKSIHVHVATQINNQLGNALNDPDYIEFRRRIAFGRDAESSDVCEVGQQRTVEASQSPDGNGQSSNGHGESPYQQNGDHH